MQVCCIQFKSVRKLNYSALLMYSLTNFLHLSVEILLTIFVKNLMWYKHSENTIIFNVLHSTENGRSVSEATKLQFIVLLVIVRLAAHHQQFSSHGCD